MHGQPNKKKKILLSTMTIQHYKELHNEMFQPSVPAVTSDYKNINRLVTCTHCSQKVVFFGIKSLFIMNK